MYIIKHGKELYEEVIAMLGPVLELTYSWLKISWYRSGSMILKGSNSLHGMYESCQGFGFSQQFAQYAPAPDIINYLSHN